MQGFLPDEGMISALCTYIAISVFQQAVSLLVTRPSASSLFSSPGYKVLLIYVFSSDKTGVVLPGGPRPPCTLESHLIKRLALMGSWWGRGVDGRGREEERRSQATDMELRSGDKMSESMMLICWRGWRSHGGTSYLSFHSQPLLAAA